MVNCIYLFDPTKSKPNPPTGKNFTGLQKTNMKIKIVLLSLTILFQFGCTNKKNSHLLDSSILRPYIENFNQHDNELYPQHVPNDSAYSYLAKNVPLIEVPDKDIEETYYFRWWTFRKHLKKTEDGFVITEFLPKIPW